MLPPPVALPAGVASPGAEAPLLPPPVALPAGVASPGPEAPLLPPPEVLPRGEASPGPNEEGLLEGSDPGPSWLAQLGTADSAPVAAAEMFRIACCASVFTSSISCWTS